MSALTNENNSVFIGIDDLIKKTLEEMIKTEMEIEVKEYSKIKRSTLLLH